MFQVQIAMHHDFICLQDDHFEKAQEFRPERWLRSNKARDETHPFASVPFGFGPRACIGRRFAEQESHIALIKVLHRLMDCIIDLVQQTLLSDDRNKKSPLLTVKCCSTYVMLHVIIFYHSIAASDKVQAGILRPGAGEGVLYYLHPRQQDDLPVPRAVTPGLG